MMGFLGDPIRLFMKPEKADFFLSTADFGSLLSSEFLLGLINWLSGTRAPWDESAVEELACWRRDGLMVYLWAMLALSGGEMLVRWKEGAAGGKVGDLKASMRLRMAAPSNGAPMKSSEGLLTVN